MRFWSSVPRRAGVVLAALAVVGSGVVVGAGPASAAAAKPIPGVGLILTGAPIERHYSVRGSAPVTARTVTDPASGGRFELYLPEGTGDRKLPIVTWGNGTNGTPLVYDAVLRQLASWGFAVIDSYNPQTGAGTDILAGATYLARRADDPRDPLHGRLDTDRVAAVGHSQGAAGVLNATRMSRGLITTTVPIGLPTRSSGAGFFPLPANVSGLSKPVFYIAGGLDLLLCPPAGIVDAYRRTHAPAAVATRRDAEHLLLPRGPWGT